MAKLGTGIATAAALLFAVAAHGRQAAEPSRYEGPVIDVHLHADSAGQIGPPGQSICPKEGPLHRMNFDARGDWRRALVERGLDPPCDDPLVGAPSDAALRDLTIEQMRRYNVRGLVSGPAEYLDDWVETAPDLFWPSTKFYLPSDSTPSPEDLAERQRLGTRVALAEIVNQYAGIAPGDPRMAPYWEMAEREELPVGIHLGIGPPGAAALYPEFRAMSPLELDPVLRRHPRLRIFVMHAGYPFLDDMKAMLYLHPQLMVDTAVLQFQIPRAEYYAYLESLVRAGYSDRIMFGSDQMVWPGAIGEGIDAINDAPFLTFEQKKAILHDNAARFLGLPDGAD